MCICNFDRWFQSALPPAMWENIWQSARWSLPRLLSVIQKCVACVVKGQHRKFSIHPKHTVRANAGYLDRQGYQKAGLDTKRTVTWKICFCRGLDRPLFQILTPQSCLLRYWQCRYHFSGICSCSRLRLKEKQQNHPRLIWNLSELLSTMLGMWQGGVGWGGLLRLSL